MSGYLGDRGRDCRCTPDAIRRYRARLSGPLLDRIDLQLFVPRAERAAVLDTAPPSGPGSATIRRRVTAALARQMARQGRPNADLSAAAVAALPVSDAARTLLVQAMDRLQLSARGAHRALKVAQTVADLVEAPRVEPPMMAEALGYRALDSGA